MLYRNDIFDFENQNYRLLHVYAPANLAWVISLDEPFSWPEAIPWSEISALTAITSPSEIKFREPSTAMKERQAAALERVTPLISHIPDIFAAKERGRLVEQRAQQMGCSERTLHKDLRRYWQGGQNPDALLADYHHCGRAQEGITSGRGRQPMAGHAIYQLTEQDLEYFKAAIEKIYLKDSRISVAAVYQRVLEKNYTVLDGNGTAYIRPHGSRPTLKQFKHFLYSNYPLEVRIRGREGNKDFERDHRAKLGTVMADCLGVGHYYEIDATIADVYLVSSQSVDQIIGKPTLYLIIDRKSRLIVGFYVGMEHASWVCAMEAILSISADKHDLCARYDVQYEPEDWPAHQVFPKEFLADRGEMISMASAQVSDGLQVTVTNLPGLRPDWKPLVECSFKLTHESIRDVTPAYDPPSNATKRRGKHYEKDACLTLKDFSKIILESIITHNRKAMRSYALSLEELTAGLEPSPISLWNHNIVERAGLLTRFPENHIRYALLPQDTATVTEEGIIFRGCHYTCSHAVEKGWFVNARKTRFRITVSYDSRLVDTIYVHGLKATGERFPATLTSRSDKYRSLSFAEVKFYEALRSAARPSIEQSRAQANMEFHRKVDPVTAAAKKKLRDSGKKKSRTARRADVKEDRQDELRAERQALAPMKNVTDTGDDSTLTDDSNIVSFMPKSDIKPPAPLTGAETKVGTTAEQTTQQRLHETRKKMLHGY
jgi:putative transposase